MNPLEIIEKYYKKDSELFEILVVHSNLVAKKALEIAKRVPELSPDLSFICEAAMLHDIGIFKTHAPIINCHGDKNYLCHGYLGREILEKEGYTKHALVCERHTGTGLSLADITNQKLPLPQRDMRPQTIEEEIICLADKFYSKNPNELKKEKTIKEIKKGFEKYGKNKVEEFEKLARKYKLI